MWRFSCAFSKKMLKFLYYNSVEEERGVEVGNKELNEEKRDNYISLMKELLEKECGISLKEDTKILKSGSGAYTIEENRRRIYMRGTSTGTPSITFAN